MVAHQPDEHGAILLGGSDAYLQLEFTIRNRGERDAGRGKIEVSLPPALRDPPARWSDAGGHELPDRPERASRVGPVNLITRDFEAIPREVPETVWLRVHVEVPRRDHTNEYPIRIGALAEGANGGGSLDFPLRIGRNPNL